WKDARAHFSLAMHGPVNDLMGTLLSAWSAFGANDVKGAVDAIDKLNGPAWYGIFRDMHPGLILALANNKKEAGTLLEHSYKLDITASSLPALRVIQSHAGFLSRNGGHDEALKIYEEYDKQLPRYPLTLEALALLRKDAPLPRIVETA